MMLRAILLACGVLGAVGAAFADQTDPRLEDLFATLEQAPTADEAAPIEQQIWAIWFEAPDEVAQSLMSAGVTAMQRGDYDAALKEFDQVIASTPDFAEGWNRRATLYYLTGDLELSLADITKTLELEPRHFGALSGRGLVYTQLGELDRALDAFEAALAVNPRMPGPKINADAIRRMLDQRDI